MIDDAIMIIPNVGGTFDVRRGNRLADGLTFEEMLGLVAQMTMGDNRKALQWLRTPEEKKIREELLYQERGAGEVILTSTDAPCGQCDGKGALIDQETGMWNPCFHCHGTGREAVAPV